MTGRKVEIQVSSFVDSLYKKGGDSNTFEGRTLQPLTYEIVDASGKDAVCLNLATT